MQYPPTENSARISEIFSSLQGEGIHLGERHLFLRFEECNRNCSYCDERGKVGNELTLDQVLAEVWRLDREEGPHAYVSLTGGEPLLYSDFLRPLMKRLKSGDFRIYLETNGVLWQALADVIGWCDCVAMDMKPSSVTGEMNSNDDHERFLRIAKSKETFVKFVLSKQIDPVEFENQIRIIAGVDPKIPIVLQPVSEFADGHHDFELMSLLNELQRMGLKWHRDIRIVPRFHKMFNLR